MLLAHQIISACLTLLVFHKPAAASTTIGTASSPLPSPPTERLSPTRKHRVRPPYSSSIVQSAALLAAPCVSPSAPEYRGATRGARPRPSRTRAASGLSRTDQLAGGAAIHSRPAAPRGRSGAGPFTPPTVPAPSEGRRGRFALFDRLHTCTPREIRLTAPCDLDVTDSSHHVHGPARWGLGFCSSSAGGWGRDPGPLPATRIERETERQCGGFPESARGRGYGRRCLPALCGTPLSLYCTARFAVSPDSGALCGDADGSRSGLGRDFGSRAIYRVSRRVRGGGMEGRELDKIPAGWPPRAAGGAGSLQPIH